MSRSQAIMSEIQPVGELTRRNPYDTSTYSDNMPQSFGERTRQFTSTRPANSSSGSQTQTQAPSTPSQPVLRLRGSNVTEERHVEDEKVVRWAEDVVDNEGLGRKSSKVCCIYHAPKGVDESSDESSSDSSSDDSDCGDDGSVRPSRPKKVNRHKHMHDCGHGHDVGRSSRSDRTRSPNAYEKVPTANTKGKGKEILRG